MGEEKDVQGRRPTLMDIVTEISFNYWNNRIMSDAMEYDLDPAVVERQLQANYQNHYGCEE